MVNTAGGRSARGATRLITTYVVLVVATILALGVLSTVAPGQVNDDAWVHAVIVAVVAVLLPIRLRSARRGSAQAWTAIGIVASVLVVVNVLEAAIPGLFPAWMRVEMAGLAALMAAIGVLSVRARRS